MKKNTLLFWLCLLTFSMAAQTFTVESVPDPKTSGGGYISDPAGYLQDNERRLINFLISQMEDSTTAQVAVVILPSIGDQVPKDFATALFNHWGIGQASKDNGLLLLAVMDQRRTEIETGYGLEGVLPDVIVYRILLDELIPQFQQQAYGQGILAAINRIKSVLEDPAAAAEIYAEEKGRKKGEVTAGDVLLWYLIVNFLFHLGIGIWILLTLGNKEDLYDKYRHIRYVYTIVFCILFPVPYLLVFFGLKSLLKKLRNQKRYSKINGQLMHKMTEEEEDEFLEKGQVSEEEVKSVDYDVWITEDRSDIMILPYNKRFSQYKKCPKCQYRTYHHAYTKVLRHATYYSEGSKESLYECKNCNYIDRRIIIIPILIRSSSGGGGGGGGGGGSWGGGSSGGGGGGASW